MTVHAERKYVPYTPEQMFGLVADVEKYPQFIPWCTALRVRSNGVEDGQGRLVADMAVKFKVFREKFRSQVDLDQSAKRIDVAYIDGPFRYLENIWRFEPTEDGGCVIDFHIAFEFRNRMLQMAISQVFDAAVEKLVAAFVGRADALYGAE